MGRFNSIGSSNAIISIFRNNVITKFVNLWKVIFVKVGKESCEYER